MTTLTIAHGVYRLARNVENPTPDRRKNEWRAAPTIKAGTVFHVVAADKSFFGATAGQPWSRLYVLGDYMSRYVPLHDPLGQALIPALVPEGESLGVLLYTSGEDGEGVNKIPLRAILARLVERKIVTLDQVREIIEEHNQRWASDDEWVRRFLSDHGF